MCESTRESNHLKVVGRRPGGCGLRPQGGEFGDRPPKVWIEVASMGSEEASSVIGRRRYGSRLLTGPRVSRWAEGHARPPTGPKWDRWT